MRGKGDPSRGRDTPVDDPDDRDALPDCGGGGLSPRRSRDDARRRDRATSSTPGRGHTRHRSRRPGDSAGRSSGEGACPRRWSSGNPLQLDVQPKPWHNRQDSLGVLEPEAVTRVRRISPGPHPQSLQRTRSLVPRPAEKRAWTVWKTAQHAVSHTAHSPCLSSQETPERRATTRTSRRAPSRFPRSHVTADTAPAPVLDQVTPGRRMGCQASCRSCISTWRYGGGSPT